MTNLRDTDPVVFAAIQMEESRQQMNLELIASENYTSKAVREAQASCLTDKYAEGYPHKRYYGGCGYVDIVEDLARERLKALFNAEHANVQPHSGAQANMAVYMAMLQPGDTVLGMDLSHGGHLTHGSKVNFSGKLYNFIPYGVMQNGLIDYDMMRNNALKYKPKMIVAGASAYPRKINFQEIRTICDEVGAYMMVDMAHIAGIIAAGLHQSPVPFADFVTSTTHKTLRGPRGGFILCKKDYAQAIDKSIFPGIQGGPLEHIIAAKAVCFKEAMEPSYVEYIRAVLANAKHLSAIFSQLGITMVSGGTDNHLLLLDLRSRGITGKDAEERLGRINVTVNKNTIPNDPEKPTVASGIRIGTPAITTRGMGISEMSKIAKIISDALAPELSTEKETELRFNVMEICNEFPIL